uniref:Uncharacterized protein n=1 Tax=Candidatus Kentrum sp. SD TaxID=2126332 RepID=A0A450YDZ2_9GAMM|nr:MAG: hypothetical protein BECKSD772F_GA0070984_103426 [Candidatus Kentron sp. SD]VFK39780.1 MAG: hypothetical protein BECKSD772E_GA0070983_100441 [Candidatus Kentron sp. SD]VFK78816.1 MAG: hypothetical protein BECKSD772D_GA0070982_102624 [Candidatus Kentron sp. SD]
MFRKNKNSEKTQCPRKEHPVWSLLLRANMFPAKNQFHDLAKRCLEPTIMLRVPITLENETTTPVGRVEPRLTRPTNIQAVVS